MKKFIKWLLVISVLFVAILMILPLVFQSKITTLAKEEINKNVNAQVDFDQVSISFISAFPNVSLSINDLQVIGIDDFAGDTLAYLKELEVNVGLMGLLKEPMEIKSIIIDQPYVYAKVLKDGKANWDIAKVSEEGAEGTEATTGSAFVISLKKLQMNQAQIVYVDESMNLFTEIHQMDFQLSGDLSADFTSLSTQTNIEALSLKMDGIPYFNKNRIELNADLDADLINSKYTFKENLLKINELELAFDGSVAMPTDDIVMDMTFEAKETAFKHILSLVPSVYMSDFQDIKTEGVLSLQGFAKGMYNENQLPAFDVKLIVDDAMFQYPDLPAKVENIAMNLHIENKDGVEDHTIIDLKKFHLDMAGHPFDMNMLVNTPVSDPNIDGHIKGKIDLSKMKDIMPSEDMKMSGLITADVELKGKMSDIENENYELFHALGNLAVQGLYYADNDLPQGIEISSAIASISPQYIKLDRFDAQIGNSDMSMTGKIENFLGFYFKDDLLKGKFSFAANKIDLGDFMGDEGPESEETIVEEEGEMTVIEIPKNIDFFLSTQIKELLYDNIEIKNVEGGLQLKDGIASMKNLNMQMLEGKLKMNGNYSTQDIEKPAFDLDLEAQNFDVKQCFDAFNTIQKIAPIAKHAEGNISSKMNINGLLLANMDPDLERLNSTGRLQSDNLTISNADLFKQIGGLLKIDKFNQFSLAKIDLSFKMENGDLIVKPFETKFGKSTMTIGGSQKLDQSIDYGIDFTIPSSELGSQANDVANQLLGEAGKFGVELQAPENIKFKALVGGTLTEPKVSLDLKNQAANIAEDLKKQAEEKLKQEVDKAKQQAIEEAKKQAAQIMAEADKQGKKLIAEAQKIANQAKKEANKQADAANAEAYKQADALIKEAGDDTMKKLLATTAANKIKLEADKAAEAAKKEAAKQANKGVNEARKQSDTLKAKAKKEGDALIAKAEAA